MEYEMSCSSTQINANTVVWGYGENQHAKLTIDNTPKSDPKKPMLSLLSMDFNHLHSYAQDEKTPLSLSELRGRLLAISKCKETYDWLSGDMGYSLGKEVLSVTESDQIKKNAHLHAGICGREGMHASLKLLEQLYREIETEQNQNIKDLHNRTIIALRADLGLDS